MLLHYYSQNVKSGIQIRAYKTNKECVPHFSQFISVKRKTKLRKSQAQFRGKLRKLRLRPNDGFLIKNFVYNKKQKFNVKQKLNKRRLPKPVMT